MIITDEKTLRQPCIDVRKEEVGELREKLEKGLEYCARIGRTGVGLSLPQIGIHKKMAIVRAGTTKLDLINCRLVKGYDEFVHRDEGCLSFPNRTEDVFRYQEIVVDDNLIYPHSFVATGLVAVIIQHELDHLNSALFFDRAVPKPIPVAVSKKTKLNPNDKCPCLSGLKYKKCCGK